MATVVTGAGPLEMKELAAKIHAADKVLKANLRKQMRGEAAPVVRAVQASILSMPSRHDGTLRREIAKTVSANISFRKTGVSLDVLSRGTRMPPGKGQLPVYIDRVKGWHHPVYGNRRNWVPQEGKPGWFEDPIIAQGHSLRTAVEHAMTDTARELG